MGTWGRRATRRTRRHTGRLRRPAARECRASVAAGVTAGHACARTSRLCRPPLCPAKSTLARWWWLGPRGWRVRACCVRVHLARTGQQGCGSMVRWCPCAGLGPPPRAAGRGGHSTLSLTTTTLAPAGGEHAPLLLVAWLVAGALACWQLLEQQSGYIGHDLVVQRWPPPPACLRACVRVCVQG